VANDDPESGNRRATLVAVVAVIVLALVGWFLARELSASARLQDCVLSGRTNCAPLEGSR
jgi:O-antigen ligase